VNPIIERDLESILTGGVDISALDQKTVFLSGANSFITSYIVYAILKRNRAANANIRIVALCRSESNAKKRFGEYLSDPHLMMICQDIREPIRYDGDAHYCVHAASPAGIQSRQANPADTYDVNVFGCKNMLEFCREHNTKRFLLISSVDVYGKGLKDGRLIESDMGSLDPLYPRNAYANGKRAAETLCALYSAEYGFSASIARPFQVYGPGMALDDGRLNGDFVRQIIQDGRIVLKSDGSAVRSFMYLSDATSALFTALLRGESGQAYNICDERGEASVFELARYYKNASGANAEVTFDMTARDHVEVTEAPPCVIGSSDKLKGLGWKPAVTLQEGILRTLRYYTP
jgi:nucleoside-diphosphate-sugar epimerase